MAGQWDASPNEQKSLRLQLKPPETSRPQVHSGVPLGKITEVLWQGLLKNKYWKHMHAAMISQILAYDYVGLRDVWSDEREALRLQLKVPESLRPQVHSGVLLGSVTEVFWQGLLKKLPNWLCATMLTFSIACARQGKHRVWNIIATHLN